MRWILSTPLPVDHRHYTSHILHNVLTLNDSTVNTEDFVYASHSLEISFITSFKTTFLAQLMHGETRNKSKLKSIQAYNNRLGYLPAQTFRIQ